MATKSQMLNVNMGFNADVSKAKSAIQDLQKDLDKLMSPQAGNSFFGNDFVKDIDEARRGAQQLSTALRSATNADTGKLDLTKFSQSLKKADLDIDKVKNSLTSFGPEGEKAFLKVADSIMDAEVPLKRTNKLFNDLWVTMKNTAKWQLSSSVLHGFMGAIQTAYGYSQDLNESLNNIRIVTGYGADQMAEFAKQANQAAKSLSTTTTAYTNAALIYYQQGLPEEDIAARTNATVKMANVTGESAQDVSNYMTAIWNNFDDGSHSLEYYADVMTALGAATASSTDEIAAGLEKFAAVSETVGLSYEYATSALATVTATTRQSADVVGNAFKTLFSRIQGLNLGKTMEDGTTLNKYSQALAKVGIDIKDTNGQIKEMDVILDELGEKWGTLGKDTQIALAQAVAGVRQYTQLIALMDNWDTFKINLEVAGDAEGELNKQQAIYEESWEASSKRVRAAWEGIYDSILDDDFFIGINNGFADFLSGIENVIDGLGGMKGVVLALSAVLMKAFGPQMAQSINNVVFSIQGALGIHKQNANKMMNQTYDAVIDMNKDRSTADSEAMIKVAERQKQLKNDLATCEKQLTEEQKKQYQTLIDQDKIMGEILIKAAKEQQISDEKMGQAHIAARSAIKKDIGGDLNREYQRTRNINGKEVAFGDPKTANKIYKETTQKLEAEAKAYVNATQAYESFKKSIRSGNADIDGAKKALGAMGFEINSLPNDVQELEMTFLDLFDGIKAGGNKAIEDLINDLKLTPEAAERVRASLQTLSDEMKNNIVVTQGHETANENYKNSMEALKQSIDNVKNATKTFGEGMVGIFQGISSIALAITSLSSIKNIIDDESLTTGEKYLQVITSLGTAIPSLIMGVGQLAKGIEILTAIQWASVGASIKDVATKGVQVITNSALGKSLEAVTIGQWNLNAAMTANPVGALIIAIGALIAILGGLTYAIVQYADKQQAAFKAMESAREEAEKTAEAYSNMKDSYASLIDTIENYEDAKNAISDLSKGTEEWYENINKANEYARELIDTYDELAGKYHFNSESGLIEFDPGALEDLQGGQQNRLTNLQANALMADSAYKQATSNYNVQNAAENENVNGWKLVGDRALQGLIEGAVAGVIAVKTGLVAGSAAGPAGTLAGGAAGSVAAGGMALTGGVIGAGKGLQEVISQNANDDKQAAALNRLIEEYKISNGVYEKAFNNLSDTDKELINALDLETTQLQELCNEAKAATDAIKLNNQQVINSKFADTDTYKNFEEKDALNSVLANVLETRKQEINDSYNDVTTDDMRVKYAEEMGYQTTGFTSKDGKTTFYDMEGKEVVFSDDTIRLFSANTKALAELSGRIDSLAMAIDGIESRTGSKSISESLTDWLSTGNMLGMSQNDRDEMFEKIDGENGDDTLADGEILEFLRTSFGVDDEGLKEIFGVDDVNEVVDKWVTAWENGKSSIEAAGENITKTSKKVFDELKASGDLSDLSGLEANQLGEYMDQVLGEFGKTGLDRFSEIFAKTGEDADEFINVLDDIDWQTTNISELERALKEAGVTTDFTSQELAEFIEYMRGTGEASDLATAREHYTALQGMSDLSLGDTITQDQMNTLTEVNPALSNFFTLMADGTYALTESATAFNSVVEDLSTQKIGAYVNQVNERMELAGNLRDSNFNYDSAISLTHQAETMGAYAANSSINMDSSFDYLEMMNGRSAQLEDWRVRSAEGTLEASDYEAIRVAIEECGDATKDWEATVEGLEAQAQALQDSINFSAYKDQVADLGLNFEFTESYAEDLAENMEDLSDEMEASGRSFNNIKQAARDLAIANQRLDRGLSGLAGSYDDYIEKLTDANKGTVEYTKTMNDLKDNLADIFNTDAEYLSSGFIEEAFVGDPEKLKQIADGNMEVIRSMRAQVASEVAGQIYEMNVSVDSSEVDAFVAEFDSLIATMPDLTAMAKVDGENAFIEKLNGLIQSAGMTRDQVQALLGSMGMSAELVTEYKQTKVQVPVYKTYEDIEPGEEWTYQVGAEPDGTPIMATVQGYTKTSATVQSGVAEMDGYVPVTSVKTITEGKSSGGGIDIIDGGVNPGGTPSTSIASSPGASSTAVKPSQSNVYNPTTGKGGYTGNKKSSGGGGGNKEAKTSDPKKLEDEIDRYYDIDNILEKISRQLKKIQQQSDTLYGASKIAAMEHEIEVLKEQEQAYRDKAAAAEGFIKADREAAAQWGYTLSYDSDGNISNYQQVMTQAVADLNAYKQQYNAMSADEQERFEPVLKSAEDRYEGLLNAMSKYEDTLQTFRDAEDAAEEARLQRLAKNYEKITHKLEYKLSIVEQEIEEIDYYVNKLSDDFYSMGEALAMASGKTDEYFKILNLHSVAIEELSAAYEAGEITQADYIEGMENERQGIYDTLEALQEMDKFMLDYYGETLDAATDEIEKFTDQMDHLNNVLEHYQNIMSLIGKENNYDQMGILLKGQADIAQDSLEVAKATYEMFKQQKEDILAQMEGVEEGSAAWDGFKRQLDDITIKLNDAEEEMLSRTEEWVEAMRSLLENDLANAYKTLENSFTNGMGFDYLTDSIDRAREHYDLFLTNTNKLYETNKLINNAQAKADKLTSLSAKQKVKDFIDETQALQDKNKLSKIELQIQQAKYDLVLAQIALEEAQNSKSRVRLQRDSEGNFNYVYTSDADAISEAEQNLMDAENALYNIRLEAANAAGEQMVTTAREWADALYQVDLDYMNGVITSEEEWRAKRDQINKDFLQQMADYQDQYGIATKEDGKIVSDAWCNPDDGAYPLITKSAEDWKINTNNYISQVNGAFEEWKTVVDQANEVVGKDLDATKQKVNELTEASDALKDEVINEVLPAISSELNTVQDLTSAYFNQRQEIMNLIGEYERLAERIKDAIDAQKELNAYQAQAQKDLSDTYTGGQFTYADEAPPKEQGGGGGGYQPPPGYDDTLEKPADSEKRYRISAIFKNGAAISGAGYKSESSARSRINQEGNKNKGVKSSSIIAYLGKKNEMEFFQYTKLGTQTNTTTSYSNSLIDQSANNILGLDTGGYTGVWGPEGKLAALHEKELVLNKSDTENMLSAVKIVRDINNQIENSAKYFGSLSSHIGLPAISDMSQILEQTVTIDANFPNVESRYEIEEAFKNLMNTASQFANRKRL